MGTEITLTLEDELISKMQDMARMKGKSISEIIADYVHSVTVLSRTRPARSPVLAEITGVLHSEVDNDGIRRKYTKHLVEKYL